MAHAPDVGELFHKRCGSLPVWVMFCMLCAHVDQGQLQFLLFSSSKRRCNLVFNQCFTVHVSALKILYNETL